MVSLNSNIIVFTPWEFQPSALSDGLSLTFESVIGWSFTDVWVTTSLLRSAELFFEVEPIVWGVPTPPLIFTSSSPCTKPAYRAYKLQLLSPSFSCSIVFSAFLQGLGTYNSFRFLYYFYSIFDFTIGSLQSIIGSFSQHLWEEKAMIIFFLPSILKIDCNHQMRETVPQSAFSHI